MNENIKNKELKIIKADKNKSYKIQYIDGIRLNRAITSGIHHLISRQDYLNKINVFPIPDGDTGTNMAFTMSSILDVCVGKVHTSVDKCMAMISEAAIDNARGNSGVLIAQWLVGFSEACENIDKLNGKLLMVSLKKASESATEAMEEPKEGTILTVFKDFAEEIENTVNSGNKDLIDILAKGYDAAKESLADTPNKLDVLKRAGVVDAGAQGFVDFLTGIITFINEGRITHLNELHVPNKDLGFQQVEVESNITHEEFDLDYRFCTECRIKGNDINKSELKNKLKSIGNSLVVAGSRNRIHVHIHANEPAKIFSICENFGNVDNQKADDMFHQQQIVTNKEKRSVAIVTDSSSDFHDENLNIYVVPVRYNFGTKGYIDKVSQTPKSFYKELINTNIHPQTSQPTPGDFKRQFEFLSTHYETIISIHLPPDLSGTYQSALNASKKTPDAKINIVNASNVSVGTGLIVKYAARLVKEGKSHEDVLKGVNLAINRTKVFAIVKDLKYAVKGGRVSNSKKIIAEFLNIKPILTIRKDGTFGAGGFLLGKKNMVNKTFKFIIKRLDLNKTYDIAIGHCMAEKNGELLRKLLYDKFSNIINSISLIEAGCALGVHAGPGALIVGIQEELPI